MDSQSVIPKSDDKLLSYFLKESILGLLTTSGPNDPNGKKREDWLPFILLGLILIVGTEPLKVLLRKNIGKLSLSLPRLAVAAILYIIWGGLLYYISTQSDYEEYKIELFAGVVFYALFGITVLFLGTVEYFKAMGKYNNDKDNNEVNLYRGDSLFFSNSSHSEADKKKIWWITEPIICFVLGLVVTILPMFINPILGLIGAPLLASSLSFWFNEAYQVNNVWNVVEKKIAAEKMKALEREQLFVDPKGNFVRGN